MNRKNLTAAVLAGLAGAAGIVGSAQAVNINPDGIGQVLIYPYYTTNGGNTTLISVVNSSDQAKAVKVRFLEGQNSREVLDFNMYMSAYDVWAAALYNDNGTPTLVTSDSTCTVPYIYNPEDGYGSQAFLPYALTDGGSSDISRTAEGHLEMIEMGTLVDITEGSATAATHVVDPETGAVAPADCQQLVDAWTDPNNQVQGDEGYWLQNPFTDMEAPSGGLFGGASVVNVTAGTMYSYDARAINGFATDVFAGELLHQPPGSTAPSLNSGDVMDAHVFGADGSVINSSGLTRGVDAVSFVFMHDQIMNEYTTESEVGASTEWVVTFPTKAFYTYQPSSGSANAVAPFTSTWDGELPGACEVVTLDTIWDREEQTITGTPGQPVPPIVSPAPPNPNLQPIIPFELCFETSVIEFGPASGSSTAILGSTNFHNIDNTELGFETGWVRLQLDDYSYDANQNGQIDNGEDSLSRDELGGLQGLPVTGFAVERFQNAFLGDGADVLANYGGIFQHKGTRKLGSLAVVQ